MAKDFAEWFYKSKAWKQTRAAYIIYCGGYCERCRREVEQGRRSLDDMKPIKIVHHKVYLTPENINDPTISLSFDNLEGLCDDHHNKEHKEGQRRYRFDKFGNLIPNDSFCAPNPPPGVVQKMGALSTEGEPSEKR